MKKFNVVGIELLYSNNGEYEFKVSLDRDFIEIFDIDKKLLLNKLNEAINILGGTEFCLKE